VTWNTAFEPTASGYTGLTADPGESTQRLRGGRSTARAPRSRLLSASRANSPGCRDRGCADQRCPSRGLASSAAAREKRQLFGSVPAVRGGTTRNPGRPRSAGAGPAKTVGRGARPAAKGSSGTPTSIHHGCQRPLFLALRESPQTVRRRARRFTCVHHCASRRSVIPENRLRIPLRRKPSSLAMLRFAARRMRCGSAEGFSQCFVR
jgi:hypothetical protein